MHCFASSASRFLGLPLGFCIIFLWSRVHAFPSNRHRFPNGFRVPCPPGAEGCKDGLCPGFAHFSCHGGTFPLNSFGADMKAAGQKWTKELCEKDSDGDGLTNGEELGDPCCLWESWDTPSDYTANFAVSHPGVASSKVNNYQKPSCDSTKPQAKSPKMGLFNAGEEQKVAEVFIDKYTIPMPGSVTERTTYTDIAWNFPDESASIFHVVLAEAIVKTPKKLHHYVVTGCSEKWPDSQNGKPVTDKAAKNKCNIPFGGWAPGRKIIEMPAWAGQPIGAGAKVKAFLVNVHYDNPTLESGVVSNDGMKIYYTPTLRNQSLSAFSSMEVSSNPSMFIPSGKNRYFMTRGCKVSLTDAEGKAAESRILTIGFHAHLLGAEMYAERIRDHKRLTLATDAIWHFDDQYQEHMYLKNITIKDGDTIQSTCVFNSHARTKATVVGLETTDEMCWNTFFFTKGGLKAKCTGQIWTGLLAEKESGLGIDLRHSVDKADMVWTGTNLKTGGNFVSAKGPIEQVCSNHKQLQKFCPSMAGLVPKKMSSCDLTLKQLKIPTKDYRAGMLFPLGVCCTSFCATVCPDHPSCKGHTTAQGTTVQNSQGTKTKTTTPLVNVSSAFSAGRLVVSTLLSLLMLSAI